MSELQVLLEAMRLNGSGVDVLAAELDAKAQMESPPRALYGDLPKSHVHEHAEIAGQIDLIISLLEAQQAQIDGLRNRINAIVSRRR